MKVELTTASTLAELAALSAECGTLYFGVGIAEEDALLQFTSEHLSDNEALVIIDANAGCLAEMERPARTPAIGAWCSKGMLVGYEYAASGVLELMREARRFAA